MLFISVPQQQHPEKVRGSAIMMKTVASFICSCVHVCRCVNVCVYVWRVYMYKHMCECYVYLRMLCVYTYLCICEYLYI